MFIVRRNFRDTLFSRIWSGHISRDFEPKNAKFAKLKCRENFTQYGTMIGYYEIACVIS